KPFTFAGPALIGLAGGNYDQTAHALASFDNLGLDLGDGPLGWNAALYADAALGAYLVTRRDADLDFAEPAAPPLAPVVPAAAHSVRWQADVGPSPTETYTFTTLSQGQVRVTVNGQTIIDRWTAHALDETTGTVALQQGQPVRVVIDYANPDGTTTDGRIQLRWSSASQPDQPVPFAAVRPIDSHDDGMPDAWETLHGFDLLNSADAALDADGDGLTNLLEYQLGGNPHAADDRLPGVVTMETWTGVYNKGVRDLTKHEKFQSAADQ